MIRLGIIAEDMSDVAVMRRITEKIIAENQFSTKQFVGNGCGRLRRKCMAWAENLRRRGCTHIVVIHDLDEANERELRNFLEAAVSEIRVLGTLVLIPVREIEAWLLTDGKAIQQVFGLAKEPRTPQNPENVTDPKATLEKLVWGLGRRRYVNSIHNEKIAKAAALTSLKKCRSFAAYPLFLRKAMDAA